MVNRAKRRQMRLQKKATVAIRQTTNRTSLAAAFSLLLVFITLILYSPVRGYDFINYDDDLYIVSNPYVTSGLNWTTIRWSLTSTESSNWHPLTWLSHALDCQLFGLDPGDHHLTSAFIHAINVLLLFLLLWKATDCVARSFVVTALFALHPFNVQSVAWLAERKNLLSTFFFLLALGAYGWYARHPRLKFLAVTGGLFIMSLASKPMAVTLPFVLLLLDYWPLQRIAGWTEPRAGSSVPQQPVSRLLLEKLPLFVLSGASSALTVWAQRSAGALRTVKQVSFFARLENALDSYIVYIWKTLWPSDFGLFYPHPGTSVSAWKPASAVVLLLVIGIVLWRWRIARPYLIVGWLWFVGTLFPVMGIVQVGDQAMADRYFYLPSIGLFLTIVWGTADVFELLRVPKPARWLSASGTLILLGWLTSQQLIYWKDSVTIWSHTLMVTDRNSVAERKLAFALAARGDTGQVVPHLANAVRLDPENVENHVNLGVYYAAQGRLQDGIQEFQTAIKLTDHQNLSSDDKSYRCWALLDLGTAYATSKDYANALANYQRANEFDPLMVDQKIESIHRSLATDSSQYLYLNLSLLLRAKGKSKEASLILNDAVKANPRYIDARELLNFLDASQT